MSMNENRSKWAKDAMDTFQDITGTDDEDVLQDLLCDLMHYANQTTWLDFELELVRARDTFFQEIEDDL